MRVRVRVGVGVSRPLWTGSSAAGNLVLGAKLDLDRTYCQTRVESHPALERLLQLLVVDRAAWSGQGQGEGSSVWGRGRVAALTSVGVHLVEDCVDVLLRDTRALAAQHLHGLAELLLAHLVRGRGRLRLGRRLVELLRALW